MWAVKQRLHSEGLCFLLVRAELQLLQEQQQDCDVGDNLQSTAASTSLGPPLGRGLKSSSTGQCAGCAWPEALRSRSCDFSPEEQKVRLP